MRDLAPISPASWSEIEDECARTLRHCLAGRKLVDYDRSGHWLLSSRSPGRTSLFSEGDVAVRNRVCVPVAELRADFTVVRADLAAADRGAQDLDTASVVAAARAAALAEDQAVFNGNPSAGIVGLKEATPHDVLTADSPEQFRREVARAINILREAGIDGPYGIAIGPQMWTGVAESVERGAYPLLKQLRLLVDGPVIWAPALMGAVVLSQRGGDFLIGGDQDWSIGYSGHSSSVVELYLQSSFTFAVNTPEAAVALTRRD